MSNTKCKRPRNLFQCRPGAPEWVVGLVAQTERANRARRAAANAKAEGLNAHSKVLGLGVAFEPESAAQAAPAELAEVAGLLLRVPEARRNEVLVELSMQAGRAAMLQYLRAVAAAQPTLN
jgi:hypothetical protein